MKILRTRNKKNTHVNVMIEGIENQDGVEEISKVIKEVLQRMKHNKKISYCIISTDFRE